MTNLIILSMLLPGPKHGYRIKQEAGLILGQDKLHSNLVYPLLRRFVSEGLIKQKIAPGERGQTRKLYSLTPLGHRTLVERLTEFSEQDARSADAFQLRVGFFLLLPAEVRQRVLSARETALRSQDEKLAALQKAMDLGLYGGEVVHHLRERNQAELDWVRHLRQLQKKQEGKSK